MGGHAVAKIYQENSLNIKSKGNTDVGKEELLTRADLVSNHLILGLLKRFPAMNVSELKLKNTTNFGLRRVLNQHYTCQGFYIFLHFRWLQKRKTNTCPSPRSKNIVMITMIFGSMFAVPWKKSPLKNMISLGCQYGLTHWMRHKSLLVFLLFLKFYTLKFF